MGARKQRWSEEEEKTLKAGIQKHGAGKWTAILKDPDFKPILCARSNVDLKDKFRNMNVVRTGEGYREKTMRTSERSKQNQILDKNHVTFKSNDDLINEMNDVKLLTKSTDSELSGQNKERSSLESLILEAVACFEETEGSSLACITSYIADNVKVHKSQKAIGENLKALVEAGKLVKVRNGYKLVQNADLLKGTSPKVKRIEAKLDVSVKSGGDLNFSKSSNIARPSRSNGGLEKVSISIMSEELIKPKGDVNVNILADNEGSQTHEGGTAHEAASYHDGLPTYKDRTVQKAAANNEVLSTYKDMTAHEAAADNEGLPTYEDRTAHKAAEAVAMAEVSRAEHGEALTRLKLAKAFLSASHSLLEKLSMEMSRRNAKMKEADMSLG